MKTGVDILNSMLLDLSQDGMIISYAIADYRTKDTAQLQINYLTGPYRALLKIRVHPSRLPEPQVSMRVRINPSPTQSLPVIEPDRQAYAPNNTESWLRWETLCGKKLIESSNPYDGDIFLKTCLEELAQRSEHPGNHDHLLFVAHLMPPPDEPQWWSVSYMDNPFREIYLVARKPIEDVVRGYDAPFNSVTSLQITFMAPNLEFSFLDLSTENFKIV